MASRTRRWLLSGRADRGSGTEVTFKASTGTFTKTEYDYALLERRLRELAFLNSGMTIVLRDERHTPAVETVMRYDGGLIAFVEWLDRSKTLGIQPADQPEGFGRRAGHTGRVRAVLER